MASLHQTQESTGVSLTIRLLMQGKEVGSIIGRKGEIVKRFREESGAKINISDGICPERIITLSGMSENILKAFGLIIRKFEEDLTLLLNGDSMAKPTITFRLVVPASQCGSLIGKKGSKIKEIRDVTGASIQVASEMLPNSTERTVTISGDNKSVIQCIYQVCTIMSESPPKGMTVPYSPEKVPSVTVSGLPSAPNVQYVMPQATQPHIPSVQFGRMGMSLNPINGLINGTILPGSLSILRTSQQTHEMTIPNELIGCIIGKGGAKVAEIRQLSGAMIRISNCEDRDAPGHLDRTITITGSSESVALAQYLISMRISMETATMGGMAGFQYLSPNHIVKTSMQ